MSVPVGGVTATKAQPTSSQASINEPLPNISSHEELVDTSSPHNSQLYENVKLKASGNLISLNSINNNSSNNVNVPYENINLEYINRLMKEGYTKENVIAALGISRNNFEMACDILNHYVDKEIPRKVCESNR